MRRQLVMTAIAACGLDDVVYVRHFPAVGNEIESCAGIVGAQFENRQVSRAVNADRMRSRGVESGRRLGMKYILILSRSDRCDHAPGVCTRLLGGGQCSPTRRARRV